MNENNTLLKLQEDISALVKRANNIRLNFSEIKTPGSMAAMTTAHDLAMIGQEFIKAAIALKQAALIVPNKRRAYKPKSSAKQAAKALRRRGSYSVAA